jgi:hypothetical protein
MQIMKESQRAFALGVDLRDVDNYVVRLFVDLQNRFSRDQELVVTPDMVDGGDDEDGKA